MVLNNLLYTTLRSALITVSEPKQVKILTFENRSVETNQKRKANTWILLHDKN